MTDADHIRKSIADLDKAMSRLPGGMASGRADAMAEKAYRDMETARLELAIALDAAVEAERKGGKK